MDEMSVNSAVDVDIGIHSQIIWVKKYYKQHKFLPPPTKMASQK